MQGQSSWIEYRAARPNYRHHGAQQPSSFLKLLRVYLVTDINGSMFVLAFPMNDAYYKKLDGMVKFNYWIVYRQLWYFRASLLAGEARGVKELYGSHHKNLYTACEQEKDLHDHWTPMMDYVSDQVEDIMLSMMDYKADSHVLDCAGQTGLGAVKLLKAHPNKQLKVTVLDQGWKKDQALDFFSKEGVAESASFIGGDVFKEIPSGYDVIQFKHFINMFSEKEIRQLIKSSYNALPVGGRMMTFTLHAPEELKGNTYVPWCTTYFIAAAMGRGGPWKASDISKWMIEEGFSKAQVLDVFTPHTVVLGFK